MIFPPKKANRHKFYFSAARALILILAVVFSPTASAVSVSDSFNLRGDISGSGAELESESFKGRSGGSWFSTGVFRSENLENRFGPIYSTLFLSEPKPLAQGEDVGLRQWNAKQRRNPDGTITATFNEGWVHYLKNGNWLDIETEFFRSPNGFVMNRAPFEVQAPLIANGVARFINNNQFDNHTKQTISAEPLEQSMRATQALAVQGRIVVGDIVNEAGVQKNVSYVIYENAFPSGADLIYYVHFGATPRLQKLVRFDSAEEYMESVSFEFGYSDSVQFYKYPEELAGKSLEQIRASKSRINPAVSRHLGKGALSAISDSGRGIGLRNFLIWDSGGKKQKIDVELSRSGSSFLLSKNLPQDFLAGATFPIFTDATSTFYPDPDTESTSVDGRINASNPSWSTARGATSGSANDTGASGVFVDSSFNGSFYTIVRGYFLFDTASLDDSATITAATISFAGTGVGTSDADASTIEVVSSSPASNTALANSDYPNIGSTSYASMSISSWDSTDGNYNSFSLDSNGRGNISKTGVSKFGTRTGLDLNNTTPGGQNNVPTYFADNAGTTSDPKLEVTYTSGVSVSGTVFSAEGTTATSSVSISIDGGAKTTTSTDANGAYSFSNLSGAAASSNITVWMDNNGAGNGSGATMLIYSSGDVTGLNIFKNQLRLRQDDADAIRNSKLGLCDKTTGTGCADSDLHFDVSGSSLVVDKDWALYIQPNTTFQPGGAVTLMSPTSSAILGGDLYLASSTSALDMGSSTLSVGGDFRNDLSGSLTLGSATTTFTATTTGFVINTGAQEKFGNIQFSGVGGRWSATTTVLSASGTMTIANGVLSNASGSADIVVEGGVVGGSGEGKIDLTVNNFRQRVNASSSFGTERANWKFYNLEFSNRAGSAVNIAARGPASTTVMVMGDLTIGLSSDSAATTLLAASSTYLLTGVYTNSSTTLDISGNNQDGTLTNMDPINNYVPGQIGSALDFEGSNSHVALPDIGVTEGSAYSISFWAKTVSTLANTTVYSEGTPASWPNNLFIIYYGESGAIRVWCRDGSGLSCSSISYNTSTYDGVWRFVAYVQNSASDRRLYVNGVEVQSDTVSRDSPAVTTASIGANNNNGSMTQFYDGVVDDLRVYSRALSASEVSQLYNKKDVGGSLVAHWPFSDGQYNDATPLNINGSSDFASASSTVHFGANSTGGNTTAPSETYHNLAFEHVDETFNLSGNATSTNNLTALAGTLNISQNSFDALNSLSVFSTATFISSSTVQAAKDISFLGTVNMTTGTLKHYVKEDATFALGSNSVQLPNVIFNNVSSTSATITGSSSSTTALVSKSFRVGGPEGRATTTLTTTAPFDIAVDLTVATTGILVASSTVQFNIGQSMYVFASSQFQSASSTFVFDTSNGAYISSNPELGYGDPPPPVDPLDIATFYNLTIKSDTSASKNVVVQRLGTIRIDGLFTVSGYNDSGTIRRVVLSSSAAGEANAWKINHQGTESLSYAQVNNSACHANSTNISVNITVLDGGGNGTCWGFQDLEFTTAPTSVSLNLTDSNNRTATATTQVVGVSNTDSGYKVYMRASDILRIGATGPSIPFWTGTNASPTTWSSTCSASAECGFGYTTDDADLTQFSGGKYAGFTTSTPGDLVVSVGSATGQAGDETLITHRVSVSNTQPAGAYTNVIYFVAVQEF